MQNTLPWQDILDAKQVDADDLATYHRNVAESLSELPAIHGDDLKVAHAGIQSNHRKRMMETVQSRAEQMMTPQRMQQISSYIVENLTHNGALWQEVLHHQHNSCFDGEPPSRDKLSLSWIDTVQRDFLKAAKFDPRSKAEDRTDLTLFSVRSLPKSDQLSLLIEDHLWQLINDTTNPAPLPSRVPDDPALLAVYIAGVKLIYKLVECAIRDQEPGQDSMGRRTYSHCFMSAGEIAFGVLHSLDIMRGLDDTPPSSRYCQGPSTGVFVQPLDAVERQIDQRTEIAPSLGHVLCAVDYMSGQYGRGFDLTHTPAKTDEFAGDFISASQAAGLCARLGEDHAFWLPFCEDEVLSLYRKIDAGQYADDLYSPAQKTAQLIRSKMAKELADLPKEIDFQTLRAKLIRPWELRQNQIGWSYRPDGKDTKAYWIAVANALGITVQTQKPLLSKS